MAILDQLKETLAANPALEKLAIVCGVFLLCVLSYFVMKRLVLSAVTYLVRKTAFKWDDKILDRGVLSKLSYLAPALVVSNFSVVLPGDPETIRRLVNAYIFLIIILVLNALLNAALDIYAELPFAKDRPIKGYVQVVKLLVFLAGGIFILAALMNESPVVFLSGLGAMTAVLLLVFRDTILSFVASIQLATNDMVRIGDWISMPALDADGDVIDIALHTVKIQNWDKTITTIPTHRLISDSFKNWRGMSESGGRRIKRSIFVDQTSVAFCDARMLQKFRKIQVLGDYIEKKQRELDEHNKKYEVDESVTINGRRMTNLGTFRAYLERYLRRHPSVHQSMTLLVRQLQPTENGIPIEIYCFTNDTAWAFYEGVQADIFDHILAVLPEFGLRVFQTPTGKDILELKPALSRAS